MKIKICDDEKEAAKELQKIIYGIMEGQEDTEIKVYGSGKELLHDIADGDVVFLDIEMPQMDGIEAGRCLKDKADCHIILETGQIQRFKEAFFIQALRLSSGNFRRIYHRLEIEWNAIYPLISPHAHFSMIFEDAIQNGSRVIRKSIITLVSINTFISFCPRFL